MESNNSYLYNNLEQNRHTETERKFIAPRTGAFDRCRPYADSITQLYLSHPDDEYSLRVRRITAPDGSASYTATLKDRGSVTPDGLKRLEVEAAIDEATFIYYANQDRYPTLHKERLTLHEGISVDWIADLPYAVIEVEKTNQVTTEEQFLSAFADTLTECTGQPGVDNEYIAHALHQNAIERPDQVSVKAILDDILRCRSQDFKPLTIGVSGRSGSGKSTLARELQAAIAAHAELEDQAILVSTDDYHRGRQYLEATYHAPWTNWEDPRVYDTQALAQDIAAWQAGASIRQRSFDFASEEPVLGEELPASTILIVEGIHANSPDLADHRHLQYEMATPLSVSLGRDLMRLVSTDRFEAAMRTPEERLRYVLAVGEPTYQATR